MARRDYAGPGLVVHWDSDLCIHASRCWRNLPEVFQPWAKPWIDPSGADAERIRRVIAICPTGAISFTDVEAVAETDPADGWKDGCAPELQAEVDEAARRRGSVPAGQEVSTAPAGAEAPRAMAGTLTVEPDGPLITSDVRVVGATGEVLVEGTAALCRCGGSARKPFCDNTHARNGFRDPGTGPAS
jgi:uncharacterized Fe-S cluster protein YjdI/CDGSH-type Zn-finger protein